MNTFKIKVFYSYFSGSLNVPSSGYLKGTEDYNGFTGKYTCSDLIFPSVDEAFDFLTGENLGLVHDGEAKFSLPGVYVTKYGEYARPNYRIVAASTGKINKAIVSECDALALPYLPAVGDKDARCALLKKAGKSQKTHAICREWG